MQHEGETGTGGGEATSTQIARAPGIHIVLCYNHHSNIPSTNHIIFTKGLCQLMPLPLLPSLKFLLVRPLYHSNCGIAL